ncbi:competence protein ComK [Bacillus sp. DTU_2020_1000418_1_SI_GHA_SEK_038]|uniref:competence protein ComK n=1 Tax=Bacillus sp. DTU_2020_1000418_1_SI_GHA_SEK_038 TaxID=3077585 RepID=UPI0028E538DA|nr:competence protein ComK [Bacillus sp. DTU_2020_1000418_1_SI_GHA_SEK_038]WNS76794.1 competence protein ComK [Bacillus sp. DTU_2020_1000418_1_SI_GHA_SEK_038]
MVKSMIPPLIEEYEVNSHTMVIMPLSYGSKIYSQIWELEDEFISPFKPIDIIRKGCISFGSSYEGRKEATKHLTGITHKAPITVDSTNSIYFFPTTSPSNTQCIWISQEHIHFHRRGDSANTQVLFKNKRSLSIPVSFNSFNNQILRTALLKTRLSKRIENLERKDWYMINGKRNLNASENEGKYNTRGHDLC